MTIEKLSEKVNISCQNLSKIENGKGFMKADTFEKLCEAAQYYPLRNWSPLTMLCLAPK